MEIYLFRMILSWFCVVLCMICMVIRFRNAEQDSATYLEGRSVREIVKDAMGHFGASCFLCGIVLVVAVEYTAKYLNR